MSLRFTRSLVIVAFFVTLFSPRYLSAQMEVTNGPPYTPVGLIENVFLGDGVEVISVNYQGDARSVAYFKDAMPFIGMDRGVLMTTGNTQGSAGNIGVDNVGNDQMSIPLGTNFSDPDLEDIAGTQDVNDITTFTITFRPYGDTLRFNYSFASEEYPEYVCSNFNDIFGFFISGPGINGPFADNAQNIALIPGTNLPVRINNVNSGTVGNNGTADNCAPPDGSLAFSSFYVNNDGSNQQPVFDGFTRVLQAEAIVQPCQVYTIKLVIADVGDGAFDSGVFLQAKSFGGNSVDLAFQGLAVDGTMAEGCRSSQIVFSTPAPVLDSLLLDTEILGTATPGVDYVTLPDSIWIPRGDSVVIIEVEVFEDNIVEGEETIDIVVQINPCIRDTFTIRIKENELVPPNLLMDATVCPGDTVPVNATLPVVFPEPPRFVQNEQININIFGGTFNSYLNVSGVIPEQLGPGVIRSICIDNLEHRWIDDLDIFLIGPDGQILELTTDNGADGGNGFGWEAYLGTCFTETATNPITGPGNFAPASFVPFTGNWMPEGVFSDIYDGNYDTNGTWELRVIDDSFGGIGDLYEWSITFEPIYEINYLWTDSTRALCPDCPETSLVPLTEGYYPVIAEDSYGCTVTDSVLINFTSNPPSPLPVCGEVSDTTIQITWDAVPGALSYQVRIDTGDWVVLDAATFDYTFENLPNDSLLTFFIRAIFNECPSIPEQVQCMTLPCVPPTFDVTITDVRCKDDTNGSILLEATGPRGPFTFFRNGVQLTNPLVSNLAPGYFTFRVVNSIGCETIDSFLIGEPEQFTISVAVMEELDCDGQNGSLVALPVGGTPGYTYTWVGAGSTDSIVTGLGANFYPLTARDANNCMASSFFQLDAEPPLIVSLSTTIQGCTGAADGTVTVMTQGGVPGYTYQWSDPVIGNTPTATNLVSGTYQLTISDAGNCVKDTMVFVDRESDIRLSAQTQDVSCFEGSSGAIDVTVQVGSAPYTFSWNGQNVPGGDLQNIPTGNYQLQLQDQRNCIFDTLIFVDQPSRLFATVEIDNVACGGQATGAIDLTTGGGTGPYTFSWTNGPATADLNQLLSGTYNVAIRDDNNCPLDTSFFVPENPQMVATFTIDPADCFERADGAAFVAIQNGVPPYSFNWSQGSTENSLLNVLGGDYGLAVTDAFGCRIDTSVTIGRPDRLEIAVSAEDIRCHDEDNGIIRLTGSGGTPGYQYRLDGTTYGSVNAFLQLAAGNYAVSIRDAKGCVAGVRDIVIANPEPLELELGENFNLVYGDSIQLPFLLTGGVPDFTYQWTGADSLVIECAECPDSWLKPANQTTFFLRVVDASDCIVEDLITIFVDKNFIIAVPTGFTPNGDLSNDRLILHGRPGIEVLSFSVFDRWGEMVWQATDFPVNSANTDDSWDGNFREEPLNGGTYLWQAEVRYEDGTTERHSGQTTLLR